MNINILEGKNLDLKEFSTNLQALPFLSEKRLIILKDFLSRGKAEEQKEIADIIKETPDFCIVLFVENESPDKRTSLYKQLQKIATVEEFPPMEPSKVTKWILEETAIRKGQISQADANFLAIHVGSNLWQLSNEIDKLISAAGGQRNEPSSPETQSQPAPNQITRQLIEALVPASISSSIFKLTDAIGAKDLKGSLKIFKTLVDSGEDTMMIFYMIVRQFRLLIQVRYLSDKRESSDSIARTMKIHLFVALTTSKQCKNFTPAKLKQIYTDLLEVDTRFKTGKVKITTENQVELLLEIERFIIKTCEKK